MTSPLRFTTRAVVARGFPFEPVGEAITDEGVALDTLRAWGPVVEPLVVRVASEDAGSDLVGDWFVDTDGTVARLPKVEWRVVGRPPEARPWLEAWEECDEPALLTRAAFRHGLGFQPVALALCDSLRAVAGSMTTEGSLVGLIESLAKCAHESQRRWAWAISERALDLHRSYSYRADREVSPSQTHASLCDHADLAYAVHAAALAVSKGLADRSQGPFFDALTDICVAMGTAEAEARRAFAERVRLRIPTVVVLRRVRVPVPGG